MGRMTTDKPEGNYSATLNLFYIKDEETWVRGGGPAPDYPDVTLDSYIKDLCKAHGAELDTTLNLEEFSCMMAEALFNGPDTIEGLLATLYAAGWAFSSLRWALKAYEDLGIPRIAPAQVATIDAAIITYGEVAQMDMVVEEMAELTKAVCKRKRTPLNSPTSPAVDANIIEEIADVYIMLAQLIRMMQPNRPKIHAELENAVNGKLARLKERLTGPGSPERVYYSIEDGRETQLDRADREDEAIKKCLKNEKAVEVFAFRQTSDGDELIGCVFKKDGGASDGQQ